MNKFLHNTGKHSARTENMAVAHSTTGSRFADQFAQASSYRGRDISQVFADQSILDAEDPMKALQFVFYLRLVSRRVNYYDGKTENVQRGQGNRDEAFKRFLWYLQHSPDIFYKNLWLFAAVGRYQDFLDLMFYADEHGMLISRERVIQIMFDYANQTNQLDLMKKYLPLPKAASKLKTRRAEFMNSVAVMIRTHFGWTDRQMRLYKTSGEAHQWQQKISEKRFSDINFDHIPGRALSILASSGFFESNGLAKQYEKWISEQPVAKFTGYPYELGGKVTDNLRMYQKMTIDKQFDGLIELAKQDKGAITGNVWCALDTSASMNNPKLDSKGTVPLNVCLSLGIYFSTLNTGAFHKAAIMFDDTSTMINLTGNFTDMWRQIRGSRTAWGSTNFQSVVDEIVRIRTRYVGVPLEDFPDTLIVVSDMQFNPTGTAQTNHEAQMRKLRAVFPKQWVDNFRVIWWYVRGTPTKNFPTHIDEGGTYVFSGFDGAVISLLLGGDSVDPETGKTVKKSMDEIINDALSQKILTEVRL